MATYFTFLDGALRYDCASCGQACCRGKGAALDARTELVPLLVREPRMAPFIRAVAPGIVQWAESTDGCWFLQPDGFCEVEGKHGRSAKPTTCRLFPFNRVFFVGDTRVVDFNSVICPLQDARGAGVAWHELDTELDGIAPGPLTSSRVPPPAGAEKTWEALERAVLTASSEMVDAPAETFVDRQLALAGAPPTSARFVEQWARFLELEPTPQPSVDRHLALLTPSLRFNTLFRPNGPPWAVATRRVPLLLLATTLLARIGARRSSMRSITELHQSTGPLRELLVRWFQPAVIAAAPKLDASDPVAMPLAQAFAALAPERVKGRNFGEVLVDAWREVPGPMRGAALAALARSGADLRFDDR